MWTLAGIGALAALIFLATRRDVSLNAQIVVGALGGLLFGSALVLAFGDAAAEQTATLVMRTAGRVFVAALKMIIAPMILLSIVVAIASMRRTADLGRMGGRTLALYLGTMALAVATGLIFVNVFDPGAGGTLRETEFFRSRVAADASGVAQSLDTFLLKTVFQVLANPFESLGAGRILPIVFFAILFGLALTRVGARAEPVVEMLQGALDAVMTIVRWFMRLAPLGVMGLLAHLMVSIPIRDLSETALEIGLFFAVVWGATLFHAFVSLPVVARVLAGVSPMELLRGIYDALLVAFTTSSSAATLPVTARCVEENLAVPPRVSSFVLPLGATVNMDGTALYEAIAAIFVANIYGIELGLSGQLVVFLVAMAAATGAPGIPSAGMVTMVVVLESAGLPGEAVGLLLPFDRLLDTVRTMANVEGDCVVAVCVARAEAASEPAEP